MNERLIELRFPYYFIFGVDDNDFVDLSDGEKEITHISIKEADMIIQDRVDTIEILCALSEKCDNFDEVWNETLL